VSSLCECPKLDAGGHNQTGCLREGFRTPLGVRKSPKNEPAGHELLLWGFVILGKRGLVGMAPSVTVGARLWPDFSVVGVLDWLFRGCAGGWACLVHHDARGCGGAGVCGIVGRNGSSAAWGTFE
jgi:hypothetical protein